MAREKIHLNNAQRQQAYRQRVKDKLASMVLEVRVKSSRKRTRPQRLQAALDELDLLNQEYESWLESLPENLVEGQMAGQLQETINQLSDAIELLDAIDLPRGFGR